MPEGDTVLRTARRLDEALAGRTLLAADLRWPGLSTTDLRQMIVTEVVARGKHLLTRLDAGWTLHSHLRMEGQWRIEKTPEAATDPGAGPIPREQPWQQNAPGRDQQELVRRFTHPDIRAILVGRQWTAVGLRLGMLDLIPTRDEHTLVGHLGPDILDPDFDHTQALANLVASGTPVGAALLDQRNLAGIGTLWSSESLFLEQVNPWIPVGAISAGALARLVERARLLMTVNVGHAVQSSTGIRREGQTSYVHARSGRECRRCGTTVRVAPIGPPTRERPMFYCPGCQGGLAPTDQGRPAAPLGARRRQVPGVSGPRLPR